MAVWLVRAGSKGEGEAACLESGSAIIGFDAVPDLSSAKDWNEVRAIVAATDPTASANRIGTVAGQLWAFALAMQPGDIVAMPLKRVGKIALGKVTGPYRYVAISDGNHHTRPIEWIKSDVPRSQFGQDLLNSLGAYLTVCEIRRNDAESECRATARRQAWTRAGTETGPRSGRLTVSKYTPDSGAYRVENSITCCSGVSS